MKELSIEIDGRGEMRGFTLRQINKSNFGYVYEVTHNESCVKHYEVFERKENNYFDCVSYPSSKAFGLWAWCYTDYGKAINRFNKIENCKNGNITE